jgi:GT2 family glycosyltransferase/glycosyltransferase involved in cell wall biosynthesis
MAKLSDSDPREVALVKSLAELFDAAWYKARYPDVQAADIEPITHFIRHGIAEKRDPNPFFDSAWYLERYPDVGARGTHPLIHYLQTGAVELRDPHPHFSAAWYAGRYPEAATNPLFYHIKIGQARGYPTRGVASLHEPPPDRLESREAHLIRSMDGFFDAAWYSARYPDTTGAERDPIVHFIRHGLAEHRDPNPFFDSNWYLEHNPDVSVSGMHPLLHYLQSGAPELRNPHPNFDAVWYAGQHPESAANPLLYHLRIGRPLGFPTEKPFDLGAYLPSQSAALNLPSRLVVDVVVPVYRGLEETKRCIQSVLAARGKPLGRIIVVEDRSPDPDLVAWLAELAAQGAITLLRNPRNLGFVASVNRGMQEAGSRDVVLLNSDTEVPATGDAPNWLARLAAQAYATPRIATVSPLSNNATICGWPDDTGGPIAFGHNLEEVDAACRTANTGRFVEAPTTVGFCMYIRHKALQEVGPFDTERFTVGYGEENDFCLRASALGWQHRIACDTFVYHKGSVSFAARATKLAARAMKLLLERYPDYQRDIARYVGLGDITPYRFALTAALFRQSGLPVILAVSHGLGGGVRRHIDTLVARFRDTARLLLLEATDRGAVLSIPALPGHPPAIFPAKRLDELAGLLRSMAVSRVHIHHLLAMDLDIHALVRRLDVPFDVTVHDYFAICPQINLLPWRHSLYCGEPDIAGCNTCIARRASHGARDILTWRAEHAWQFNRAARILCPSQDVFDRLQRYHPVANAEIVPHEPVAPGPWTLRARPVGKAKMRIAVLGALPPHKGGRTVAAVAELADPKAVEIHLIGYLEGAFSESAEKRMKITGRYEDADLAGLIEKIDPHLIWFPATWPETFSYTLSTALEAGVPIAATRIGSFPERLDGRPLTWLADIGTSPTAWLKLFQTIRNRLDQGRPAGPMPRRPPAEDFYATRYLLPAAPKAPSLHKPVQRPPRIAIVPERFELGFPTPCAYIRLVQPLHHPSVTSGAEVVITDADGIFDLEADLIVTQRYAIPDQDTAERLAAHSLRTGATLVFDLDDDLLHIPRGHPDATELRPRAKIVRRMLQLADTVWLSTPGLAERLSSLRPDAVVVENRLDERIWTPPPPPSGDRPVRILCMGTATHDEDFAMIEPALTRLKAEYKDRVEIDVIGVTGRHDLPPSVNRIGPPASASRSYPGFVQWLTSVQPGWHIGLAPLLDTPFNRCKSPLKAMDYAALGLAVLASDTPVYRGSVADGPAGRLVANSAAAWYAELDRLVRDPAARWAIANRSRAAFLAHASLASQGQSRRDAWIQHLKPRHDHAA